MPTGVYERNPELIERITKRLIKWNKTHSRKGIKTPEDLVERQRQGRLRYYENHAAPNKDIPHNLDTRKKISLSMKRYWNTGNGLKRRRERSQTMQEYWEYWQERKNLGR